MRSVVDSEDRSPHPVGACYLIRWRASDNRVKETGVRGMPEVVAFIREIEDDEGELLVACVTYRFMLSE